MPPANREHAGNPDVELWITEGAKKADALASKGICAINLLGVWGFKGRNSFGAPALLADFDIVGWKGRSVVIAYDSDITEKPQVNKAMRILQEHLQRKGANVLVLHLPPGPDGEKTGVDDFLARGNNVEDLRKLISDKLPEMDDEALPIHNSVYCIEDGQYCLIKNVNGLGKVKAPLCNFVAEISDEVILDDGEQQARQFIMEGTLKGKPLPCVTVTASDFHSLNWLIKEWGSRAIVYAGSSTKDHLRTVIQLNSNRNGTAPRRIYTHTGWRCVDGERFFLTASGALGDSEAEVEIAGDLSRYALPVDINGAEPTEAIRASLRFLNVAKSDITYPLWASMFLSPLSEILNPAFGLWVSGHTGSFKSVLTALSLCHFGDFTYLNLPGSWRATANMLEKSMFILKDLPFVIDDWYPAPSTAHAKELEQKAELVIRGQGNKAGRGRLRSDTSVRETFVPRGMLISTGEQLPSGESGGARMFVLELERDYVDVLMLSDAQAEAYLYKYAMANYILWLRDNWDYVEMYSKNKWCEYRDIAIEANIHLRLPAAVAWLQVGFDLATQYCASAGVLTDDQRGDICNEAWDIFVKAAGRQSLRIDEQRPAVRFLDMLSTLIIQQKTLLIDKSFPEPLEVKAGQVFIGWRDDTHYHLLPSASYNAVYEAANKGGIPFTFKPAAVWADLIRLGFAAKESNGRQQSRIWVGTGEEGKAKWVISVKTTAITQFEEK